MDKPDLALHGNPTGIPASDERARRASSFGAAANAYAEHRPDYPLAAIRWALEPIIDPASGLAADPVAGTTWRPAQIGQPIRVLDLGAGTGKLTAQLAGLTINGARVSVVAVEPDPDMRAELQRRLPGITATAGRAEAIGLPDASVDAVLAGQSAHWFDLDRAIPEIARGPRPWRSTGRSLERRR